MGDCSANYKPVSESVGGFCESSKETPDCAFGDTEGAFVSDLGHHFTENLSILDDEGSNDKYETLKEDVSIDSPGGGSGNAASAKCLIKHATFPCYGTSVPPAELVDGKEQEDEMTAEAMAHNSDAKSFRSKNSDAKSPNFPYSRSISLPTPSKLVSALKGSREKQGGLPRKLTVTWAADVYDPIPTAVSHVPNKGQRYKSDKKKNGKNKQKSNGKSSRGSKSKDKKQAKKQAGFPKISCHPRDDSNIKGPLSEVQASIVDFDIGKPDPFCGSSFLKKSVTKVHFPVAEAT